MDKKTIEKKLAITKIIKKTSANFFKDLNVGEVVLLEIPLGYSRNRHTVKLTNLTTSEQTSSTLTLLSYLLDNFEYTWI
jgi:hypothetical protein